MDVKLFVSGHGPVGRMEDLKALRNYLAMLRQIVRPIAETGSQLDLVNQLRLPPPYDSWNAPDLWFSNTLHVFQELKAAQ